MRTLPRFLALICAITAALPLYALSPSAVAADTPAAPSTPLPLDQLRLFAQVFGHIKRDYVEPVDDDKLLTAAIKGMVASLDPHSAYLDKTDYQALQEQITGDFGGLGIEIMSEDGWIKVMSVIDDTPAFRAGIHPGDLITEIDNKAVRGLTQDQASSMMRGHAGTKVTLTLYRKAEDHTLALTITRAIIKVQSVKSEVPAPGYAYVRISSFQERTTPDLAAKLRQIATQQPDLKGLILDLRNNGGGLVQSAVGVASAFLPTDSVVVTTKGQIDDAKRAYRATFADYRLPNLNSDPLKHEPIMFKSVPIIILTNAYTASASEIVAGALQDQHRATIIGKTTFGKGSVQTSMPLSDDTALRLTTAYYYTPANRSIQDIGIRPDVPVDQFADGDPDDALVTREADYPNHLANIQDPDEKKELEARQQDRQAQLHLLEEQSDKETPAERQRDRDRALVEFGSSDDFMLQQALNRFEGKPVLESKSILERRLAQGDATAAPPAPNVH